VVSPIAGRRPASNFRVIKEIAMMLSFRDFANRAPSSHGLSSQSLKQLMAWGDHLKLGQPQIDAQHQAIFDIAIEIADIWHKHGDLAQLKAVTEKLSRVLSAHFQFEEQELAELGYEKLAEHRAEHAVILGELQTIRKRLENMEPGTVQTQPGFLVFSFVLGVTVGHLNHSDTDYCELTRMNGRP
jgi:hemerythrin-like metal-binding protein